MRGLFEYLPADYNHAAHLITIEFASVSHNCGRQVQCLPADSRSNRLRLRGSSHSRNNTKTADRACNHFFVSSSRYCTTRHDLASRLYFDEIGPEVTAKLRLDFDDSAALRSAIGTRLSLTCLYMLIFADPHLLLPSFTASGISTRFQNAASKDAYKLIVVGQRLIATASSALIELRRDGPVHRQSAMQSYNELTTKDSRNSRLQLLTTLIDLLSGRSGSLRFEP